jgi:hypothetical protein
MSTARRISRPAAPPAEGGACLADRVAAEARQLRARGDDLARFMADELDRLAQLCAFTGATTPAEHRDRMTALEEGRDEDQIARAYAEGYTRGRHDGRDLAFDEVLMVLKRSAGIR